MHRQWLLRTLELAQASKGFCAPNPAVGAIVVKNKQEISNARHIKAGDSHAEFMALRKLDYPITDATLYISLEPCSHWGKTPPCTEEIIKSGIKNVIFAFNDPNPLISDFGTIDYLRANGVKCEHVPLVEIDEFYRSYQYWTKTGFPFVTVKIAQSLDGKIAEHNNHTIELTGNELKQFTFLNREKADGILTTSNTIIADNPLLNVRYDGEEVVFKPIALLDSALQVGSDAKIYNSLTKKIVFHSVENANTITDSIEYVKVAKDKSGLNLKKSLAYLGEQGWHDLWVEAGGKLFTSLLKEKLINELYIYISPCWLGTTAVNAFTSDKCFWKNDFELVDSKLMGQDILVKMKAIN